MSLKKKIALSFFISAFVIGILVIFEYINFIDIKKEIRYLEITDTIRSKSLQLRRHEKNFFLYPAKAGEESGHVHKYLNELKAIAQNPSLSSNGAMSRLMGQTEEYERIFNSIESLIREVTEAFDKKKQTYKHHSRFFPLIELTFYERPLQGALFLQDVLGMEKGHRLVSALKQLGSEMQTLRKNGEDIINISKELDSIARKNVDDSIRISQIAILIIFPLFLLSGIGMLFFISRNIVNRLRLLMSFVEETGKGHFSRISISSEGAGGDEVGMLIEKFNDMEEQLAQREEELNNKNRELLQSKKLAAIGTLASGVAHELNNPLNNIYISAQVLQREAGDECSPIVKETLNDIVGQSIRVKGIVGDLLEYARGKEPHFRAIELNEFIRGAYKLLAATVNIEDVNFVINSDRDEIIVNADPEQMERVFINLFSNAVDSMSGKGDIIVTLSAGPDSIRIWVSDTGKGINHEDLEKVFEPFFTTKHKGTGLGLAIVFNIIRKHNGDIFVESEKDKGATFYIVLPGGAEKHEI